MQTLTFEQFKNAEFKLFEGNPILKNPFNSFVIADPSVLTLDVSHDGKWHLFCHTFFGVYRYESSDGINFKNTSKIVNRAMRPNINYIDGKYYLYYSVGGDPPIYVHESTDLVNWTDHGQVFSLDDISWADDRAWAPQVVERDGKFYMYCPVHKTYGGMAIAVGVSDSPTGPFEAFGFPVVNEGDWNDIKAVLDVALDAFIERRNTEGENLLKNIREKIENIKGYVAKISANSDKDTSEYADKLKDKILKFLGDNSIHIDEQRILTEVAIFADKVAIDEELVRLDSHFGAFEEIAQSNEPAGRKLDFLVQEMNRETNTIGSKASNADTAHLVVNIKNELEKIREQIQNIE